VRSFLAFGQAADEDALQVIEFATDQVDRMDQEGELVAFEFQRLAEGSGKLFGSLSGRDEVLPNLGSIF
jgi:hypothetical protein